MASRTTSEELRDNATPRLLSIESGKQPPSSAGALCADFQHQRADKCNSANGDGDRNRDVSVGISHVGRDTGDKAVDDHSNNAKEQTNAHSASRK